MTLRTFEQFLLCTYVSFCISDLLQRFELWVLKQTKYTLIRPLKFLIRYMVANRDIEPGEVIFQDRAAAVGPSESNPLCLDCNAKVLMI